MKKKVLIVLSDGFEDIEAVTVIDVLTRAGIEVAVAGLHDGPIKAAYGTTILPHTTIDKIDDNFDGVILPGGRRNAESLAANPQVVELIRKYNSEQKMVAAICAAPSHVLAQAAEILKGKHATGDPIFNEKLAGGGAIITDQPVTVDGNIITGMGPGAAMPFALMLAEYLTDKSIPDSLAQKWRIKR
jgi:4-methyl-5(b-hydroxyethyl)-thiazole monophosphate biosynthesis